MLKCLIVYFSQEGSVAKVGENIAAGLRSAGYQVDLFNLKYGRPPEIKGYDLAGIGLPTYEFRPPFNILDYVNRLPDLARLPVFVFVLWGSGVIGEAGNQIRHILARKGTKDAGYFKCSGLDFYLGYLREGYLFSHDRPTKEELKQAEDFGRKVAENVTEAQYAKDPEDPPVPSVIYRLERLLTCRLFTRWMYSFIFLLKRKKCNACDICIKVCPMGNIKANKEGQPVWGRNCMLCLYCELKCPQEAIISPIHLPAFRIFMLYNVSRARKNPSVSHVRVVVRKGQVERIQAK